MDNSTFCSENYNQNSKPEENFSIRLENKTEKVLPEDSFSKIPSDIDTPSPPQDDFPPVIPSGIISPIPMGTNPKIPSGDFPPIPPRYLSKIPEDNIAATSYKSTSSAPTDYKIHLVYPDTATTVNPITDSTSNPIPNIKLRESNIRQKICSRTLNKKQEPKDLKRYDGNKNN